MGGHRAKTVFLETFGCQMNELDSELVAGALRGLGYRFTDRAAEADIVLYNTCSVRQAAEDKVEARLGDAKRLKRDRPDVLIGVIGCMAERDGAALMDRHRVVDLMCGPAELDKVPLLIDNAIKTRRPQAALRGHNARRSGTLEAAGDDLELLDLSRSVSPIDHRGSAYVRITRGCNKFCAYCVVPFTRGAEVHRPPDHIVDECRRLAGAGVIEVTLLGQTVNHYRYDHGAAASAVGGSAAGGGGGGGGGVGAQRPQVGPGGAAFRSPSSRFNVGRRVTTFAGLLRRIHEEVPAIRRLRFVTSFPRDFGDDVLEVMAESPRLCRYLHLPAQSGSDRILKLMNRQYTAGQYVELIDRARHYLPDVQVASDFIVGFPTETDDDFEATAALIHRCRFKNSFIFKYSPRPGTPAIGRYADDVPEGVKRDRNIRLLEVQAAVSQRVSDEQVGRVVEVMVEGVSHKARRRRRHGNVELRWEAERPVTQLCGRTAGDLIVMFEGNEELIGRIVPVRIHTARPLTLFGEAAEQPAAVA